MQFNVAQLMKQTVGATRTYEVENEPDQIDPGIPTFSGQVQFTRTKDGILVRAKLEGRMQSNCSRCLEDFEDNIQVEIEEEFFPVVDVFSGKPLAQPEDRSAFTISENHILDLSEAIRQYTLLAMPMQPICSAQCAGLCSKCGANLNRETCGCDETTVDPRLAGLTKLLSDESGPQQEKGVD